MKGKRVGEKEGKLEARREEGKLREGGMMCRGEVKSQIKRDVRD